MSKKGNINLKSAGMLYVYIAGREINEAQMEIAHVNSYQCFMNNFATEVNKSRKLYINEKPDVEIFVVMGIKEKLTLIKNELICEIRKSFHELAGKSDIDSSNLDMDESEIYFLGLLKNEALGDDTVNFLRSFDYMSNEWAATAFWFGDSPEDDKSILAENALNIWLGIERPYIVGKQLMINSFIYKDLRQRKIICARPDFKTGEWYLVLEGGVKLYLGNAIPYGRERLGVQDINQFTMTDVNAMLVNPIYALGTLYDPYPLFLEWQNVFLYFLSFADGVLDTKKLEKVYGDFTEFIEKNICDVYRAEAFLEKQKFYQALIIYIDNIKKMLAGHEEAVISKDFLRLMNSRYIYREFIQHIFKMHGVRISCEDRIFVKEEFIYKMKESIQQVDSYKRGVKWEEVVQYFFECISGLKLSGYRVKTSDEEIDIGIVNTSMDEKLWEMGSLLIVECKNWKSKINVGVIRNIANIAKTKGNRTSILVISSKLTRNAKMQIEKEAIGGKYILCITYDDLISISDNEECYKLLINKWSELNEKIENEMGLIG